MDSLFTITFQNRKILSKYLTELNDHQLYTIPNGFNNNIWWNIAHVVVTQQLLVYGLSGLPLNIDKEIVDNYRKGTFPNGKPSLKEVETIKKLLFELPEKTEKDYKAKEFNSFNSYTTSANVTLNNVDDAVAFNVFHEGLHLGSILALVRAING
ncbi:hypothetical protein GCM10011414_03670 [Croceivirga lutea]|uniref:DinB family protein n=1 Tax=Croceivirga lutea TaxID=1775167 RepID=UPI00163ABCCE|nr:DinB family protein [Croceivirga lutea]GGG37562.1 hypothetical protein GCM10011414_03670 [Croceivirga lutea]